MKIIINTINIYHIHDNNYHTCGNNFGAYKNKADDADFRKFPNPVIVNGISINGGLNLIAQLEARLLQSERENKELSDRLNAETNDNNENKS